MLQNVLKVLESVLNVNWTSVSSWLNPLTSSSTYDPEVLLWDMQAEMLQGGPVSVELEMKAGSDRIQSEVRHGALLERASEAVQYRVLNIVYSIHELDLERL